MNLPELKDLERQRQELQRRLNDHHENADQLRTLIGELAQRIAFLTDIINRARTKFCEDGSDGAIAAEMFRILGEAANPNVQAQPKTDKIR